MTTCTQIDELLLSGDDESLAAAKAHAQHCGDCAQSLESWRDISVTARTMQADWENETLWPRIERRLAAEREPRRQAQRGRFWQIAAAILLTIGIGASTWYAARVHSAQAAFDHTILRDAALRQADDAEKAHLAAIEKLEKLAEPKLQAGDSALFVNYREKLLVLDDAIADCRAGIDRNRRNAHLRRQLLTIYTEKQQTLQSVLGETTHVTNQ